MQRILICLENGDWLAHASNHKTNEEADLTIAKLRKDGLKFMFGGQVVKQVPPHSIGYVGAHKVRFG